MRLAALDLLVSAVVLRLLESIALSLLFAVASGGGSVCTAFTGPVEWIPSLVCVGAAVVWWRARLEAEKIRSGEAT